MSQLSHFRLHVIGIFLILYLKVAKSLEDNVTDSSSSSPVLIVNGNSLQGSLAVQIVVSAFLVLTLFDFLLQTFLVLYVFVQMFFGFRSLSEFFFGSLGLLLYCGLRMTYIPMIINPIPWDWGPTLPDLMVKIFLYFNVVAFVAFYGLSAVACGYFIAFIGITGKKMKGSVVDERTGLEPMVVILMPIYNEEPDALFRAVESAVRCNYRSERLHLFLAFDEEAETALYFALLKKLKMLSKEVSDEIKTKLDMVIESDNDGKMVKQQKIYEIFPPRLEWDVEGVRVTICRFPHEGKSPTQGKAFKLIDELYGEADETSVANTLILFIDSDIILHENAIHNFVTTAVANPKIKGMTGLVTCRTSRKFNIYQYIQDSEYVDGQMFSRTAEATLGAVTCLPGALTLIRLNALQKVATQYFIEIDKRRTVDFHRYHLGEDRYMTFLLTEQADGLYQVRFVSSATCKTDAPDTFQKLLKQRRRWFLGGFVNDISTITSPIMWTKVPLVVLMKTYFYSSRGFEWIFPILVISLAVNTNPGLAIYLVVGSFLVRYLILCCNALIMMRSKMCISYIVLFFFSPFFNMLVTLYAIKTWSVRSWGGPRTDADSEEVSKGAVLDEVMTQKEEKIGKTRKSLGQIRTASKIIENNLQSQESNGFGSNKSLARDTPVKKFVPFPYETTFLGGGDRSSTKDLTLLSQVAYPPPSPTLSTRSVRLPKSPYLLHPEGTEPGSGGLQHSNSMPDLTKIDEMAGTISQPGNSPYIFSTLSLETQRRASGYKLDMEYLAKVEQLATLKDSQQRGSDFNLRLSESGGRSRESSIYSLEYQGRPSSASFIGTNSIIVTVDSDSPPDSTMGTPQPSSRASSISNTNSQHKVDIVIHVSHSDDDRNSQ